MNTFSGIGSSGSIHSVTSSYGSVDSPKGVPMEPFENAMKISTVQIKKWFLNFPKSQDNIAAKQLLLKIKSQGKLDQIDFNIPKDCIKVLQRAIKEHLNPESSGPAPENETYLRGVLTAIKSYVPDLNEHDIYDDASQITASTLQSEPEYDPPINRYSKSLAFVTDSLTPKSGNFKRVDPEIEAAKKRLKSQQILDVPPYPPSSLRMGSREAISYPPPMPYYYYDSKEEKDDGSVSSVSGINRLPLNFSVNSGLPEETKGTQPTGQGHRLPLNFSVNSGLPEGRKGTQSTEQGHRPPLNFSVNSSLPEETKGTQPTGQGHWPPQLSNFQVTTPLDRSPIVLGTNDDTPESQTPKKPEVIGPYSTLSPIIDTGLSFHDFVQHEYNPDLDEESTLNFELNSKEQDLGESDEESSDSSKTSGSTNVIQPRRSSVYRIGGEENDGLTLVLKNILIDTLWSRYAKGEPIPQLHHIKPENASNFVAEFGLKLDFVDLTAEQVNPVFRAGLNAFNKELKELTPKQPLITLSQSDVEAHKDYFKMKLKWPKAFVFYLDRAEPSSLYKLLGLNKTKFESNLQTADLGFLKVKTARTLMKYLDFKRDVIRHRDQLNPLFNQPNPSIGDVTRILSLGNSLIQDGIMDEQGLITATRKILDGFLFKQILEGEDQRPVSIHKAQFDQPHSYTLGSGFARIVEGDPEFARLKQMSVQDIADILQVDEDLPEHLETIGMSVQQFLDDLLHQFNQERSDQSESNFTKPRRFLSSRTQKKYEQKPDLFVSSSSSEDETEGDTSNFDPPKTPYSSVLPKLFPSIKNILGKGSKEESAKQHFEKANFNMLLTNRVVEMFAGDANPLTEADINSDNQATILEVLRLSETDKDRFGIDHIIDYVKPVVQTMENSMPPRNIIGTSDAGNTIHFTEKSLVEKYIPKLEAILSFASPDDITPKFMARFLGVSEPAATILIQNLQINSITQRNAANLMHYIVFQFRVEQNAEAVRDLFRPGRNVDLNGLAGCLSGSTEVGQVARDFEIYKTNGLMTKVGILEQAKTIVDFKTRAKTLPPVVFSGWPEKAVIQRGFKRLLLANTESYQVQTVLDWAKLDWFDFETRLGHSNGSLKTYIEQNYGSGVVLGKLDFLRDLILQQFLSDSRNNVSGVLKQETYTLNQVAVALQRSEADLQSILGINDSTEILKRIKYAADAIGIIRMDTQRANRPDSFSTSSRPYSQNTEEWSDRSLNEAQSNWPRDFNGSQKTIMNKWLSAARNRLQLKVYDQIVFNANVRLSAQQLRDLPVIEYVNHKIITLNQQGMERVLKMVGGDASVLKEIILAKATHIPLPERIHFDAGMLQKAHEKDLTAYLGIKEEEVNRLISVYEYERGDGLQKLKSAILAKIEEKRPGFSAQSSYRTPRDAVRANSSGGEKSQFMTPLKVNRGLGGTRSEFNDSSDDDSASQQSNPRIRVPRNRPKIKTSIPDLVSCVETDQLSQFDKESVIQSLNNFLLKLSPLTGLNPVQGIIVQNLTEQILFFISILDRSDGDLRAVFKGIESELKAPITAYKLIVTESEKMQVYLPSPESLADWVQGQDVKPHMGIPNSGNSCATAAMMHFMLGALKALPVDHEFNLVKFVDTDSNFGFVGSRLKQYEGESRDEFGVRLKNSQRLHEVFVAMMHYSHQDHADPQVLRGLQLVFDAFMTTIVTNLPENIRLELGIIEEDSFNPEKAKDIKVMLNVLSYALGMDTKTSFSLLDARNRHIDPKKALVSKSYDVESLTNQVHVNRYHRHVSQSVTAEIMRNPGSEYDNGQWFIPNNEDPKRLCWMVAEKADSGLDPDFFDAFVVDVLDEDGVVVGRRKFTPIESSVIYFGATSPEHFVTRMQIASEGTKKPVVFDDSYALTLDGDDFDTLDNDLRAKKLREFKEKFKPNACMYITEDLTVEDALELGMTHIAFYPETRSYSRRVSRYVSDREEQTRSFGPGLTLERFVVASKRLKISSVQVERFDSTAEMIVCGTGKDYQVVHSRPGQRKNIQEILAAKFDSYELLCTHTLREAKDSLGPGEVVSINVEGDVYALTSNHERGKKLTGKTSQTKYILNANIQGATKNTVVSLYKNVLDNARANKVASVEMPIFHVNSEVVEAVDEVLIAQREILLWLDQNPDVQIDVRLNVGNQQELYRFAWAHYMCQGLNQVCAVANEQNGWTTMQVGNS